MKRIMLALSAIGLIFGMGACDPNARDTRKTERMKMCIEAGGSFKYHGNSGSFDCIQKGKTRLDDHTS